MTPEQQSWKTRLYNIGISQSVFADIIGVSKAAICEYLNCQREPVATRFEHIRDTLKRLENNIENQ